MVDEPFTGLHQDLVDLSVEALKLISQEKLVLVVAHNANPGMFDQVIEL